MPCYPHPNRIRCEEATGGTETSKYPEERKSTETPGVAASETGPEPKPAHVQATGRCCAGVAGRDIPGAWPPRAELQILEEAERHGKAGRSG